MKINISMVIEEQDTGRKEKESPISLAYIILNNGMKLTEVREHLQGALKRIEESLIKEGKVGIIV